MSQPSHLQHFHNFKRQLSPVTSTELIEKQKPYASFFKSSAHSVLKVNQLDALLLNQAIDSHLESYLQKIIPTTHWTSDFGRYALKIFVRYMCLIRMPRRLERQLLERRQQSAAKNGGIAPSVNISAKIPRMTLGDQMQNLCYKASESRTMIFILASVLGEGFFSMATQIMSRRGWSEPPEGFDEEDATSLSPSAYFARLGDLYRRKAYKHLAWKIMIVCEKMLPLLSLLNFVIFLLNGRYRSLADRICGMRLHYARRLMYRQVSFDYMNRDLIWDGFAELILFILPLVNVRWIGNRVYMMLSSVFRVLGAALHLTAKQKKNNHVRHVESLQDTNQMCPVCGSTSIEVPHVVRPCNHLYCYYCVKKQLDQEGATSMRCTLCSTPVVSVERLSYDSIGASKSGTAAFSGTGRKLREDVK